MYTAVCTAETSVTQQPTLTISKHSFQVLVVEVISWSQLGGVESYLVCDHSRSVGASLGGRITRSAQGGGRRLVYSKLTCRLCLSIDDQRVTDNLDNN